MALDALYLLKLLLRFGSPVATIPQVGKGNAELALSLVGYDQELKSAMECVFGSTFVCKTIDAEREFTKNTAEKDQRACGAGFVFSEKTFSFSVRDSLINVGPIKDFSYGLRINADPNAVGIAKQSNYELCAVLVMVKWCSLRASTVNSARNDDSDSKNEQEFKDIKVSFRKVKAMQAKDLSQGDWLSKKRDILMVVASLIATMAFQAGINPPGGFWPDNAALHRAGEAIMAYNYPNTYPYFIRANTTGFVASVSTILLLITGWPFKKKFFMWLLVVIMWVTITSIAFTYAFSIVVVSPKGEREPLFHTIVVGAIVWCCVMVSLLIAHTIRVINWWLKTNKGINVWPQIKDFFKSKTSRQGTNSINGDVNQI
ncbi:hypothetical protein TEA_026306 [Camellia sinensis var. sinensis]|uniref:PGG domain-containing protein n=1 Tax=Camellia sinensis var. sinensis TaxID=542762 RepID=A0A4S4DCD8_CAMSN|nr:hypothetical protein TEA_026306 [Camellia sinensis var. sinensis]